MRKQEEILKLANDAFGNQRESTATLLYVEILLDIRDSLNQLAQRIGALTGTKQDQKAEPQKTFESDKKRDKS